MNKILILVTIRRTILLFGFFILLSLFLSNDSLSQIQNWPPGGLKPATSFSKVKLSNNRFVPSSRRWNLIWSDQLIPGNLTPYKVEFAAKNYIGTQKIFLDQADLFRNFNANFLVLIYHLASGLNPGHNDDCPDPKTNKGSGFIGVVTPNGYLSEWDQYFTPWIKSQNLSGTQYEDLYQHYDFDDSVHRVWHQDPYWLMNITNSNWAEYIGSTCLGWMFGMENEGAFFDVGVEFDCSLYNPKAGNPAPGNFDWWLSPHKPTNSGIEITDRNKFTTWMNDSYLSYFQNIYKLFHQDPEVFLVIPNVDQMITTVYDPSWLDGNGIGETVDGAMMENFGNTTGSDMYLTLERGFRHITQKNKILIAQFPGATPEDRLRRTAMYMLIKNDVSFLNIINTGKVEWYPEYEIDLGKYVTLPESFQDMLTKGNGTEALWKRGYDSGEVICNTSSAPIDYKPSAEGWTYLKTSGGGEIGSDGTIRTQSINYIPFKGVISVKPSECLILRRFDSLVSVRDGFVDDNFALFPNPAENSVNFRINIDLRSSLTLSIIDVLGAKVRIIEFPDIGAGKSTFNIDLNGLSSGVYTCVVSGYNFSKVVKLLKK